MCTNVNLKIWNFNIYAIYLQRRLQQSKTRNEMYNLPMYERPPLTPLWRKEIMGTENTNTYKGKNNIQNKAAMDRAERLVNWDLYKKTRYE